MLKPTYRFFVIPLGAIVTLASLSSQSTVTRPARDGAMQIRQQVVDCAAKDPAVVCVISFDDAGVR